MPRPHSPPKIKINKKGKKIIIGCYRVNGFTSNSHTISDYKLQIRIPPMKMCTRCNFIWQILSVTCCRSANFSGNSGFLHQYNWQSLYKFEILLTFSEVLGHIWPRIWPVCGSNLQSLSFSLTYHQILSCETQLVSYIGKSIRYLTFDWCYPLLNIVARRYNYKWPWKFHKLANQLTKSHSLLF